MDRKGLPPLPRRRVLWAAGVLSLAAAFPRHLLSWLGVTPDWQFFDTHQAAVVREATARLIPGPQDDPAEAGHPGAREANVVRYIDTLLGAFPRYETPKIFAGGPWSDRAGGTVNYMAAFVPLSRVQRSVWRSRIRALQATYRAGIAAYDAAAGGDFTALAPQGQDRILAEDRSGFRDTLFTHAIEGMYAVPEYGGNHAGVGWREIQFPGDRQPTGYSDEEVSQPDGVDPVHPFEMLPDLATHFEAAVRLLAARRTGGR